MIHFICRNVLWSGIAMVCSVFITPLYRRWWTWATERWRNSARLDSAAKPELKFDLKEISLRPAVSNCTSLLRWKGRICWLAPLGQHTSCGRNAPLWVSIAGLPLSCAGLHHITHSLHLLLEKTFEFRPDKPCLLPGLQSKEPRGCSRMPSAVSESIFCLCIQRQCFVLSYLYPHHCYLQICRQCVFHTGSALPGVFARFSSWSSLVKRRGTNMDSLLNSDLVTSGNILVIRRSFFKINQIFAFINNIFRFTHMCKEHYFK